MCVEQLVFCRKTSGDDDDHACVHVCLSIYLYISETILQMLKNIMYALRVAVALSSCLNNAIRCVRFCTILSFCAVFCIADDAMFACNAEMDMLSLIHI